MKTRPILPSLRKRMEMKPLVCAGCTLCCHRDAVTLLPDEMHYQKEPSHQSPTGWVIAHKDNGDCFYLNGHGCSIHPEKPSRCREMDCRIMAQNIRRCAARELARRGKLSMAVWQRGKSLLILLLLLIGCGTQTEYVGQNGEQLYPCGTQLCLEVTINGQETECINDSGARGGLWLSQRVANDMRLSPLWCYDAPNTFGGGVVSVCMLPAVTACAAQGCQEVYPYSVEMIHDCLWGLI